MDMKKGLSALLCLLLLTGCTRFNANVNVTTEPESSAESSATAEPVPEAPEAVSAPGESGEKSPALEAQSEPEPYAVTTAAEDFEAPFQFVAEEAGSYRFEAAEGDEELGWEVYVLDEAFEDAPRYLTQAYDPVFAISGTEEEELELAADQVVYCFCTVNSFTAEKAAENGTLTVCFTPAEETVGVLRANSAGVDVDAAKVWQEGGWYSFQAERDGVYTLSRDGEADWEVYVLNETFDDALRYLPQAEDPVAVNEGDVDVKAGQMVYCQCSENSFTAEEAPEDGEYVLHLEG
jgi:hypothetical protein